VAVLPSGISFAEKLIVPAFCVIVFLVAIHFVTAMTYARRIAARARRVLRAGHERAARNIILGIDAGFFGHSAYRFLPQDLRDRFQNTHQAGD
jgi:hypothetical protein